MNSKSVWQIKFYGARGSTPVCEPGFQLFGGNTTCIYTDLLINDRSKMIVVFDAGTGIRKLGKDILNGKIPNTETILLIFTHLHWDHIQGFPFFEPAYNPQQNIGIFYPREELHISKLKQLFEVQMQKEYFPVQLENMGANFHFFNSEEYKSHFSIEDYVTITYREHKHPGGAFSYRFEAKGRSIVICTDLEHGETIDREVVDFCQDADLLIHDGQYSDEELNRYQGWGHSSFSQAIEVAELANAKQVIITHHDPDHNDDYLLEIEEKCRERFRNCSLAREGMEFLI